MKWNQLARIQLDSHGYSAPFDFPVSRVSSDEIQRAMFFDTSGNKLQVESKIDLEAVARKQTCLMVHKMFGKQTVYKLFISR